MSSVGSLSTSTSTSIRGYGGLASGLDRDELIEGMTIGTRTKINKQEQKKQQIEWMQEAVRTISDKMISFHGKYTETLTSPTNLFSSILWGRNKITTTGMYSSKVSVSGTANSSDTFTIMGIKQKAENAKWASKDSVSDNQIGSTEKIYIQSDASYEKYNLDGANLHLKYDGKDYTITFSNADYKYDNAKNIADALNDQLKNITVDGKTKLSDLIKATGSTTDAGNGVGTFTLEAIGSGNENKLEIIGGTAAQYLFAQVDKKDDSGEIVKDDEGNAVKEWTKSGTVQKYADEANGKPGLVNKQTFEDYIADKSLTFSYNGNSASVKMPGKDALTGKTNEETVKAIAKHLQTQFDQSFGKGRVKVDGTGGSLSFKTTLPDGKDDKSSTLTLTGGDVELVGDNRGAFKDASGKNLLQVGDSTKLNLNAEIANAGIQLRKDSNVNLSSGKFKIGTKEIDLSKGYTLNKLMSEINNDDKLDFTIKYNAETDKFTFTSKDNGASGTIKVDKDSVNLVGSIFGLDFSDASGVQTDTEGNKYIRGKDAIVSVKYADADEPVELHRDSNSFTIDGLTVNVKGTFGYEGDNLVNNEENAIEVNATVDVDKLMDTIKSFVEEYNSIVDMVNTELTTKHEKDYAPLSSEQKSEMSEDEIEKWEAKAKSGLLYGDSDLRNLSMDLRTVATSYVWELGQVGISVSSSYSDNGKLSIDETKLRSALENNPESVEKLFTATEGIGADGKKIYNGVATNLKSVMDKYVNTMGASDRKGILIRKAGSKSSALSMTDNTYYNQLQSIEKLIASLNDRLKTERDRYIKQFTSLETLISNMNSQSSYLSSMSGY